MYFGGIYLRFFSTTKAIAVITTMTTTATMMYNVSAGKLDPASGVGVAVGSAEGVAVGAGVEAGEGVAVGAGDCTVRVTALL